MSDFSSSYFWESVSGNHEAKAHTAALIQGKVASATWWPFLSHAGNEAAFEDRLSIVAERIEASVGPEVYADVISSLRNDYRAVTAVSKTEDGLGCPDCKWTGSSSADRTAHIKDKHPDSNSSDSADMQFAKSRAKESSIKTAAKGETDEGGHPTHIPLAQWHESNPNARDYSYHKFFQCPEHPKAKFSSKNPYDRSMFPSGDDFEDCDHPISNFHYVGSEKVKAASRTPKEATNYQPDPNAAWRYHYPNLNGPVDNGALMDSDGFVKDLAEGEDRSTPKIEQEITPGTWTAHDGMPERPMPAGVARGYQPVNASLNYDNEGFLVVAYEGRGVDPLADPAVGTPVQQNPFYFNGEGAMGANEGFPQDPSVEPLEDRANTYGDVAPIQSGGSTEGQVDGKGYSRSQPGESPDFNGGAGERKTAGTFNDSHTENYRRWAEHEGRQAEHVKTLKAYEKQPGIGRAHADFLADQLYVGGGESNWRQEGHRDASLRVANQYIKQQGDKWVITQKGTGKVLSHHDSEEEAKASFAAMEMNKHSAWYDHSTHTNEHEYQEGREHGLMGHGLFDHYTQPTASYEEGHQNGSGQREDLDDDEKSYWDSQRKQGAQREPGAHSVGTREIGPNLYNVACRDCNYGEVTHGHQNADWLADVHERHPEQYLNRHQASTDGKIVDHCPGCDKPRRVHSTAHGDEVRHIHNNHVRCFGKNAAMDGSDDKTLAEEPAEGMDDQTIRPTAQFFDPHVAALPWGHDLAGHGRPVTFQEGLTYAQGYGTHNSLDAFESLASLVLDPLSSGVVHTADYLGQPQTNNLGGRGDNAFGAHHWEDQARQRPVQGLDEMNPNTPSDDVDARKIKGPGMPNPGQRMQPKDDDEAEDEED